MHLFVLNLASDTKWMPLKPPNLANISERDCLAFSKDIQQKPGTSRCNQCLVPGASSYELS